MRGGRSRLEIYINFIMYNYNSQFSDHKRDFKDFPELCKIFLRE